MAEKSNPVQIEACQQQAGPDEELLDPITDTGGTSGREGYLQLLNLIRSRQVDIVRAYDRTRLVREVADLGELVAEAKQASVRIITVLEGEIDLDAMAGVMANAAPSNDTATSDVVIYARAEDTGKSTTVTIEEQLAAAGEVLAQYPDAVVLDRLADVVDEHGRGQLRGYERVLDLMSQREVSMVLARRITDLAPTSGELENLIELVDRTGVGVRTDGGRVDLATAQGRGAARNTVADAERRKFVQPAADRDKAD